MAAKYYDFQHGDEKEIGLVPRKEVYLAKYDHNGVLRLYTYAQEDTVKERVARIIHDGLTEMWDVEQLFDMQVIIQEQVFLCHRVLMAAVSGYFRSLLVSGMDLDDKGQAAVSLDPKYVSPKAFKLLLQLFYKGKDVIRPNTAMEILNAAAYLQMTVVEYRCVDILVRDLGERSCLKIWEWADNHNSHALALRARNLALTKFQTVRQTEDFLKLSPAHVTTLLGHDGLSFRYDDELLEAILDWVGYSREERCKYLKDLLPFVCFPYLSTKYVNELRNNELIGLKTEFGSFVDEALTFHLAGLQKDGRQIQLDILARQAHTIKRLMPNMRRVVVLLGGCVVQQAPLTNVMAGYLDGAYYSKGLWIYAIASLPHDVGIHFASSVWRNDVFISGGSRAPYTFARYVATENTWRDLGRLPRGRQGHAMVNLDGRLYLVGGRDVNGEDGQQLVPEISMYDVEGSSWAEVGRLEVPVEGAPAVAVGDKIYVFGGKNEKGESVSVVQCLDIKSREVCLVAVLPHPVDNSRAVVVGKDIVLVCPEGMIYKIRISSAAPGSEFGRQESHEGGDPLLSLECLGLASTVASASTGDNKKAILMQKPHLDLSSRPPESRSQVPENADQDVEEAEVTWSSDPSKLFREKFYAGKGGEADADHCGDEDDDNDDDNGDHERQAFDEHFEGDDSEFDDRHDVVPDKLSDNDDDYLHHHDQIGGPADEYDEDEAAEDDILGYDEPDVKKTGKYGGKEAREEEGRKEQLFICNDDEEEEEEEEEEKESEVHRQQGKQQSTKAAAESLERSATMDADAARRTENTAATPQAVRPISLHIHRLTTMKKRQDFAVFVRKADIYVVGGQAENGNFLDDILLVHVHSGHTCEFEGRLTIPMSCMQAEMTAIPYYFLAQFFDAASCFYGDS